MKVSGSPLVSVIVPAYNAKPYIEQTLDSLLNQSYPNLEIIVVDDGSRDGTALCVEVMARNHPHIRLIRQSNQGVAAARNRGIEESRGELIAPIDADDIWFPDAVTKLVNRLLESEPDVGVAYAWSVIIDENGLLDGRFRCSKIEGDVFGTLICHNFIGNASSTLIRRACLEKVGGYDEGFRAMGTQGCEDWDLYLRIAEEYQFKVVPEFLIGYRKSQTAMTSNFTVMADAHRRVIGRALQRHQSLPRALARLSTSNFYLYLAHDSHYRGQAHESFRWLRQALFEAPLFTLLRLVFYLLLVTNSVAAIDGQINRSFGRSPRADSMRRMPRATRAQVIQVTDIENKRSAILLKVACHSVVHRLVSRLAK